MKNFKIGDYIQQTESVKLYIDDIDICYCNGKISVLFMCSQIHRDGIASNQMPYNQSDLETILSNL